MLTHGYSVALNLPFADLLTRMPGSLVRTIFEQTRRILVCQPTSRYSGTLLAISYENYDQI
jgi:hypothetical protein